MPPSVPHDSAWNEQWSVERDRYVVLLHIYTVSELAPAGSWTPERIMRDLGFSRARLDDLLGTLVRAGFLSYAGSGDRLTLTPRAISYLEEGAGRRRSVRLAS